MSARPDRTGSARTGLDPVEAATMAAKFPKTRSATYQRHVFRHMAADERVAIPVGVVCGHVSADERVATFVGVVCGHVAAYDHLAGRCLVGSTIRPCLAGEQGDAVIGR